MRKQTIFTGSAVAIITPFTNNGIDFEAFKGLIDFQIASGTQAIVVCGTTGEPATMTNQEKQQLIDVSIAHVNKRVPVIAGTGCNCTAQAVDNSINAYKAGADALLVVSPYYNKCTVSGLVAHYNAISDATPLPIIAYNVPSRTGVNITAAAMKQLAQIDNIVAIKEASGNIDQVTDICALCGQDIDIYSGEDGIVVPMMSLGAKGVISVSANIIPAQMQNMCAAALRGDYQSAATLQLGMYPLIKALFCEVNPIPVKTAAALMGLCADTLRLPLSNMEPANLARLQQEMRKYKLL